MAGLDWKAVRTRRIWELIARSLFLLVSGAYLLALYLAVEEGQSQSLKQVAECVEVAWFVFGMVWMVTLPRQKQQTVPEPSPALSGMGVVIATGLGAAVFLTQGASWPNRFILYAAILFGTGVIAWLVYRYASKHAGDIGEARFDTVRGSSEL